MTKDNTRTIKLDRHLLSTPFGIQTNWNVLTGAACSGKTTLIDMLADKGFQIIPESARLYFNMEMAKGKTIEEIRSDGAALQRGISSLQLKFEQEIHSTTVTFLDRAIPDSLTFYRLSGINPNEILPECFHRRYATIFFLDRLPFHRDKTLGPEDNASSDFLDKWLVRDYNSLGYSVVRVPVLSPQKRLAFILEKFPENEQK
jgi:predicted ATPase